MKNPGMKWFAAALGSLATLALAGSTGAAAPMMKMVSPADPGMTGAYYNARAVTEVYTKKWYCDTSVPSKATSGCEQGARANVPPPGHYDPEYAIVPIGFTPADAMDMNCPLHHVCVAHPATIDMTRVANALAMVKKTTGPMLLPTLGNTPVPGHNHYLTTVYDDKPEWWNVVIIGCTNPATYDAIVAHKSFAYIEKLMAAGDPALLPPTPTNLFLYFAVKQKPAM